MGRIVLRVGLAELNGLLNLPDGYRVNTTHTEWETQNLFISIESDKFPELPSGYFPQHTCLNWVAGIDADGNISDRKYKVIDPYTHELLREVKIDSNRNNSSNQ